MLKILISGTKGGYGYNQFANNLTNDDINDIKHLLTDGRSFVRFSSLGVVYYTIGFSENYKIYTIARSCLDVAGTGGYVAISLLIPKEKKINVGVRTLLGELMDVYFNRYVDENMHIKGGMEDIGFFTAKLNTVQEIDDQLGEVLNWKSDIAGEVALYPYADANELDSIFDKTYLNPFEKYVKVVLMEKRIADDITKYSGQFYNPTQIRIDSVQSLQSYRIRQYVAIDNSVIKEFFVYGKKGVKKNVTNNYDQIDFYEPTIIGLKISRPQYQDFVIDNISIRECLSSRIFNMMGDGALTFATVNFKPLRYTMRLHAFLSGAEVMNDVTFALKDGDYKLLPRNVIDFTSADTNKKVVLCVGTKGSFNAIAGEMTLADMMNNAVLSNTDGMSINYDYRIEIQEVVYSLSAQSNTGGTVTFTVGDKDYQYMFDSLHKTLKLYLPAKFNRNDIKVTLPKIGENYEKSSLNPATNQITLRKPERIQVIVDVEDAANRDMSSVSLSIYSTFTKVFDFDRARNRFVYEIPAEDEGKRLPIYIRVGTQVNNIGSYIIQKGMMPITISVSDYAVRTTPPVKRSEITVRLEIDDNVNLADGLFECICRGKKVEFHPQGRTIVLKNVPSDSQCTIRWTSRNGKKEYIGNVMSGKCRLQCVKKPLFPFFEKINKKILIIGGATMVLIIALLIILSGSVGKVTFNYELVAPSSNPQMAFTVVDTQVDSYSTKIENNSNKATFKVDKEEVENGYYTPKTIRYKLEFINDKDNAKYKDEYVVYKTNQRLGTKIENKIHVELEYSDEYIAKFREVWLKMQTLDVTYADVKKANEMFKEIDKDVSIKDEYRKKVYEEVRKGDDITGQQTDNNDKNRETIKYKIEQFEQLFNDIIDKKIDNKPYWTSISYLTGFKKKNKSYLSDKQTGFFDTWEKSANPPAYESITDLGENTSLKDIKKQIEN